jgi:hypothetical protein
MWDAEAHVPSNRIDGCLRGNKTLSTTIRKPLHGGSAYETAHPSTFPDQEISMFKAFAQLFATFQTLFLAANHLAVWAEETAGSFADEARMERQQKLAQAQQKRLSKKEPELITAE